MGNVRVGSAGLRWGPLALAMVVLAALFLLSELRPRTYRLRMTAGDKLGRRHKIASVLAEQARAKGVLIELVPTTGSAEGLEKVAKGELDAALLQGGVGERKGAEQVAALAVEPLHLLVKPALAPSVTANGLVALRGKRINLSTPGSGTRKLAEEALAFAGLRPGEGFRDQYDDYATLERLPHEKLPDALFTVSLMPSGVVEHLIRDDGFRVVPIRFGRALSLRDHSVRETTIPAFAYGVNPPNPPDEIQTLGTQLLLAANGKVPPEAVFKLLEVVSGGEFARATNLSPAEEELVGVPEMPVHAGTTLFLRRNQPAFTADKIEALENLRSFLVSIAVAGFFLWRWNRQRRYVGFEAFFEEVTRLEREGLTLEKQATPPLRELMRLRAELGRVKTDALEKFARGELKGAELMSGFLTHVNDVRGHLTALIMAERERIADEARTSSGAGSGEMDDRFRADWAAAIAESE